MLRSNQIRKWHRIGLIVAWSGLAMAGTETSTAPQKPSPHPASTAVKAKHSASSPTAKRSSKKAAHASSAASSPKSKSARGKKSSKRVGKKRGQLVIDSDRAREIQTALIRERYMQGEPSGTWDSATQAAMQRYQADQGWQSKTTPDSRALIKLGLGPSHDHLLNPENAMTTAHPATKEAPAEDNAPH